VTGINEEGTMPVAKARPGVEQILKRKKIAEKLKQKIGKPTTLEAAAAAWGGKQIEVADSVRMITSGTQARSSASVSGEPGVIGAAFNPANKGKVVPEVIEGRDAVYVVRVDKVETTPLADANVAEQRKSRFQEGKQQAAYTTPIQALREAATIKDRRNKTF